LKKTTSFPREAKVADSRVFRLVNESIEAKSLMLLQEADGTDEDDKVDLELRGAQLEAFVEMRKALERAGFEKTAEALKGGVALLRKNVTLANSDASAYFATAIIMMRSMQTLLNGIAAQAALQEARNLKDLDALHEELLSKSLLSVLLEDGTTAADDNRNTEVVDRPADNRTNGDLEDQTKVSRTNSENPQPSVSGPATSTGNEGTPAENRAGASGAPTAPDQQSTAAPDAGSGSQSSATNPVADADPSGDRGSSPQPSSPLLAVKVGGSYDEKATKELVQNLVNQSFKPNPGFLKWLEKTKVGRMFDKLGQSYKDAEAKGRAAEGLLDRRGSALNEGIGDWLKGIFTGAAPPSTKSTVQSMLPLTGNVGIHKLLFQDLMAGFSGNRADRIRTIRIASTSIGAKIQRFADSQPPPVPPTVRQAGGEGSTASSETQRPTQSSEAPRGDRPQGPGEQAPSQRGAQRSGAKSLMSLLGVSDSSKVKQAIDDSQIDINVSTGQTGLDDRGKKKLSAELEEFENDAKRELKAKLSSTFSESRKAKNEDLIIERWQRLAGIIK
jgi:hypothetical protein